MEEVGFIAQTLQSIEMAMMPALLPRPTLRELFFFRGTLPPTVVGQDPSRFAASCPGLMGPRKLLSIKGQTFSPFSGTPRLSRTALWSNIEAYCKRESKPLYVTGHSKGGALAFLASYRLSRTLKKPTAVYTYASPRVGDGAFAAAAVTCEFQGTLYVEYQGDLVPHLPPATGAWLNILEGYESVGAILPFPRAPHLQLNAQLAKSFDDIIEQTRGRSWLPFQL